MSVTKQMFVTHLPVALVANIRCYALTDWSPKSPMSCTPMQYVYILLITYVAFLKYAGMLQCRTKDTSMHYLVFFE